MDPLSMRKKKWLTEEVPLASQSKLQFPRTHEIKVVTSKNIP